jgi:hypothetical protein
MMPVDTSARMGGPGSLVCVGIGMTLGSHLTPLARRSFARFSSGAAYRRVPRIERLALRELTGADLDMHVTVVFPPANALQADLEIRNRLAALDLSVPQAP